MAADESVAAVYWNEDGLEGIYGVAALEEF
jgi:hypothetical protein